MLIEAETWKEAGVKYATPMFRSDADTFMVCVDKLEQKVLVVYDQAALDRYNDSDAYEFCDSCKRLIMNCECEAPEKRKP